MLANESGKLRMTKNITARPTASWCIMFLSTGEMTLAQKMTEAGKRAMTGTENRLVNIRADAGAGLGVFETLHGFDEPALLADHLRHAAATFYGTAGRAFLAKLVATRADDPDGFYELVKGLRQQFISDHLPVGSDGQVRSVWAGSVWWRRQANWRSRGTSCPGNRARRRKPRRSVSRHG